MHVASYVLLVIKKKRITTATAGEEKRILVSLYGSVIEWEETGLEKAFTNHHRTEQFGYTSRSTLVHLSYRTTTKEIESRFEQKVYT